MYRKKHAKQEKKIVETNDKLVARTNGKAESEYKLEISIKNHASFFQQPIFF